jgi:hypothetical protein
MNFALHLFFGAFSYFSYNYFLFIINKSSHYHIKFNNINLPIFEYALGQILSLKL